MAEALGLAASVIAVVDVAAKTGSAYVRIQRLWSEVKNVPNMLREKAEDIQIFEDFLAHVEDNLAMSPLPALASDRILLEKLIGRCRSALEELQDMVDRIHTRVISERGLKHRIASAKAALRKDDLEALSLKFDRALRMFQMAQAEERRRINNTAAAMIKASKQIKHGVRDDEVRSRERQIVQNIRSDPTELSIFGKFCFRFEQTGGVHAFFAAPSWLGLSVYSILAQKANMGWQISLRAHEIVDSFDVDFYDVISRDDGNGLLKYLHDRRMGLFVTDSMGADVLNTAVSFRSLNCIRTLINNGCSIDTGDPVRYVVTFCGPQEADMLNAPSGWLLSQAIGLWYSGYCQGHYNSSMIQMLGENGLDDLLDADGLVWTLEHGISLKGFYELLNRRTQGPELSTVERLRFLRAIVYHTRSRWWTLDQLSVLVSKASLCEEALLVHSRSPGHYSLLHSMAVGAVHPLLIDGCSKDQDAWAQVLTDCVRLDPLGLQHAEPGLPYELPGWKNRQRYYTPLAAILSRACLKGRHTSIAEKVDFSTVLGRVLRFWVGVLASAGIDLLEYGRLERQFHETEKAGRFHGFLSRTNSPRRHYDHGTAVIHTGARRYFIAGFTYGRLPEHWKLWITCENYEYAGDFWKMIDDQATSMPGSWAPDPVNREQENWRWMNNESPPLIWTEYRKIKPPV
ncbi:Ankyrin repeat-containing protein [Colletotrichum kahawae]|uniref:Ankyrin repeat-containing protein n=1 Tax=Colletotrichum kahawae TaxID=34407 RepID=A0AAD9YAH5_COLKA|nr:Ankyrin repeat-containing protein [Colletotrichum kahawae]